MFDLADCEHRLARFDATPEDRARIACEPFAARENE
jgi:hypothetical protein